MFTDTIHDPQFLNLLFHYNDETDRKLNILQMMYSILDLVNLYRVDVSINESNDLLYLKDLLYFLIDY